ncbi:MAG TPA: oxidoreductase [Acidisarcina sp.]|nr:oxidoreductase [Acidisarcina sp.]
MTDTIRTCVIGFGQAGRFFHTAVVHAVPGLELTGIVQRHGNEAAQEYPSATIYREAQDAIDDPRLQLIVVATPNESHFDLARRALEAGKHVVVDKPFTLSSSDAAKLVELSRAKNLVLSAYQNRRWDGDFLTLKDLVDAHKVGSLVSYESHFDRWRPQRKPEVWRESGAAGGGLTWDIGPHLIDQALVLFGPPKAVFADIRTEREGAITDDAFDIRLYYPKLSVLLRVTSLALVPGPRFAIYGNKGCYIKYGLDPQEEALKRGERFESPAWGTEPPQNWGILTLEEEGAHVAMPVETRTGDYRGYYANVRDAILGRAPLAVTGSQAWRVIRMVELVLESHRKRAVLDCDLQQFPD